MVTGIHTASSLGLVAQTQIMLGTPKTNQFRRLRSISWCLNFCIAGKLASIKFGELALSSYWQNFNLVI